MAFKLGPDGTPQVIEEKFQSIVRAEFRQAAELGGNSPLIAQAMMDLDVELRLTERQGKREIVDGSGYPTGQLFKRKGTILTLTATEAERCGVSKGMAASVQEIAAVLELSSWKLEDDKAWFQVLNASDAAIEREQERRARELRDAQRAHALKEIRELESRFTAVKTSRDAAYSDLDRIVKRQEADVASLKAQWEAERVNAGDASGKPSNTLRRRLADIDREYEAKRTAAITANAEELQAAKAKVTTADTELKALYQQIVDLRDAMSKRKPASAVTAGDER